MRETKSASKSKNSNEKQNKLSRLLREFVLPCISLWLIMLGVRLGLVTAFDGWMKMRNFYLLFLVIAVLFTALIVCGRASQVVISSILFCGGLAYFAWKQFDLLQQNARVLAFYINQRYIDYAHRNFFGQEHIYFQEKLDKNILLTLLCIVLVYFVALVAFRLRQVLLGFVPIYLVFMAGLLFGKAPDKKAVTLLIVGCGIALVAIMTGRTKRRAGKRLSVCENAGSMRGRLSVWLPAACILCVSVMAGYAVSNRIETPAMKWAPNFQKAEVAIEENVIRTVTNMAQYVRGLTGFGGDGTMSNAAPHYSNTQVLEVTVDFKPHTPIYLRGFTGETYKNGHWSKVDEDAFETALQGEKLDVWRRNYEQMKQAETFLSYDDNELLTRAAGTYLENIFSFDMLGFKGSFGDDSSLQYRGSGSSMLADYMRSGMENSIHSGILTLKYKGKERFRKSAYLPYNANLFGENDAGMVVKLGGDGNLQRADSQYSMQFCLMSQKKQSDYVRWMETLGEGMDMAVSKYEEEGEDEDDEWTDEWVDDEDEWTDEDEWVDDEDEWIDEEYDSSYSYGDSTLQERYEWYAHQHYGQINDGDLPLYQELVDREYPSRDYSEVADTVYNIQKILWQNTSYSLDLKPVPMGQDYAEYFLFSQQKGYCEHYATAATILLREFNIPARYVSGYRIDNKAFKDNGDGTYTAKVKDSDAHAWTETLQTYTGWTAWEVTPGDGTEHEEEEEEASNLSISSIQRSTPTPARTIEPPNEVKQAIERNTSQTASPVPTKTEESQKSASPKTGIPFKSNGDGKSHMSPAMLAAAAGGTLFVLICIVLPLALRFRQRRRRARILVAKEKSGKQAAGFCVAYLVDALRLAGERLHKNAEEQTWMQVLEREYKGVLSQTERRELLELARIGTYSREGASAAEQNRLWELCRKILRGIPHHCRLPRRMVFRMIFKKE